MYRIIVQIVCESFERKDITNDIEDKHRPLVIQAPQLTDYRDFPERPSLVQLQRAAYEAFETLEKRL